MMRQSCCGGLSGKRHALVTAAVLARNGVPLWRHVESVWLWMRPFGDDFLAEYLSAEGVEILAASAAIASRPRRPAFRTCRRRTIFPFSDCRCCRFCGAARARRDRTMKLSGAAKIAGIIGWPVAQSLSPRMHAFWLMQHDIDGAYVPLAVQREDFATVLQALCLAVSRASASPSPTSRRPSHSPIAAMRRRWRPAPSTSWCSRRTEKSKGLTPTLRGLRQVCAKRWVPMR